MESTEPECNEEILLLLDNRLDCEKLLRDLENLIDEHTLNISGIRCAAHTLQLAVQSALKIADFQILVRLCRAVCRELRKTSRVHELRDNRIPFKVPRYDCKTRWNSTYLMVRIQLTSYVLNIIMKIYVSTKYFLMFICSFWT